MIEAYKRSRTDRSYDRRFDHEEAARRRKAGERVVDLAREYGVTPDAIYKATSGGNARRVAYQRELRRTICEMCGGPAIRIVAGKRRNNHDGRILCVQCRGKTRRSRFELVDGELRAKCCTCHESKPISEFPAGTYYKDIRPNGVHKTCRACHTEIKRRYRATNPKFRAKENAARMRRYYKERYGP